MLNVLYIRDGRAAPAGRGEPFYYKGSRPSVVYRLRLGPASLLTAEQPVVSRLRAQRREVAIDTIPVVDGPVAT